MITEDYVSFETAKLLKEKGFDEVCKTAYETITNKHEVEQCSFSDWGKLNQVKRPTLQMAMKWLRIEKDIAIENTLGTGSKDCWVSGVTKNYNTEKAIFMKVFVEFSYEKACEAAIKYCLENLI